MMLMSDTATPIADEAPAPSSSTVRTSRCNVAGTSTLWSGPQANPRRTRLTAPGNPVHR